MKGAGNSRIFALLALLAFFVPATAARAAERPTDAAIKNEVARQLAIDPGTMLEHYDVSVRRGIVELQAKVDTLYRERRALALAQNVRGVRGVVDRIEVRKQRRKPLFLKQDVDDALMTAPSIESFRVITQVDPDGEVTLTGTVGSYAQLHLAEALVLDVKGVTGVNNNLGVEVAFARPDDVIKQDVESRLASDPKVDAGTIDVKVKRGRVELFGTVGSEMERVHAWQDGRVMGARSVAVAGLDVDPWVCDRMRREVDPTPGDRRLRRAIRDAWSLDPRVKPLRMAMHVDRGLVTLVGSARSTEERRAAAQDAANAVGAIDVVDRLAVSGPMASDRTLESRVRAALRREPLLDGYALQLFAIDGDVYLTGSTTSRTLRQLAGDIAAETRGVRRVSNNITVEPPPLARSDAELERAVEQELFWSPYVDDRDVSVSVRRGAVTLRGTVDSWFQLDEARREARSVGARQVQNLLAVRGWN